MEVFRPLQIGFNHNVLEQARKFFFVPSLTLGVHTQTNEALLEFDFLKDAFEYMGETSLPDMGMPKPRGEFLVSGSFFSENHQRVTAGRVKVQIGPIKKEVYIIGTRKWLSTHGFSEPEPFKNMSIDYEFAFGGEGYKKNPLGMGFKDGTLPNLEYPDRIIKSASDKPDPAGLTPLDPTWPQRARFQGTYGDDYLEKYFPGYPLDFDWSFFLCAPEDQWIEGFFQGNESFEIYGMHPDMTCIKGTLPDLYTRCFIKHAGKNNPTEFSEIPLSLDTLWFFPEKMLVLQIWRGVVAVADDEAQEISHVLIAYEDRSHSPRSMDHYQAALEDRIEKKDPLANFFKTEDLIPVGAKCAMELLQERSFSDQEENELTKNINAKAESQKKMADEKITEALKQAEKDLAKTGIPDKAKPDLQKMAKEKAVGKPDQDVKALNEKLESILPGVTAGDPRKIDLKKFSFDKIDQMMKEMDKFTDKKQKQAMEEVIKAKVLIKEKLEKPQEGLGIDESEKYRIQLEKLLKILDNFEEDKRPKAPLPRFNADEVINRLNQATPQLMEAMQHLKGMKETGMGGQDTTDLEKQIQEASETQDKALKEGLKKAETDFKETYMMAAHFMEDGLSPHVEPVESVARCLLSTVAAGKSVFGGDWACIDLSGANLDNIDLSNTFLEQVNFRGASLKGANLNGAILARANLEDADLSGANLSKANIGGVHALRTKFFGANLKSAKLSKGNFTDADFTQCNLEGIESLEMIINGATFMQTHMPRIAFIESNIDNANFNKADMPMCSFLKGNIANTDFSEAHMPQCIWADVKLENICFNKADLTKACFAATEPENADYKNMQFKGACLEFCNFQGIGLKLADLSDAIMAHANFNSSDLTGADLSRSRARHTQFRKARLTGAKLDHIHLMEGSLAKAHLVSASFVGANLYATDFLRSTLGDNDFSDSNLEGTLIRDWRPS